MEHPESQRHDDLIASIDQVRTAIALHKLSDEAAARLRELVTEMLGVLQVDQAAGELEQRRAEVAEKLDTLRTSFADALAFHEIHHERWSADELSGEEGVERLDRAVAHLDDLYQALSEYERVRLENASTASEERRKRERLTALEERIAEHGTALTSLFTVGQAPAVEDATAPADAAATRGDSEAEGRTTTAQAAPPEDEVAEPEPEQTRVEPFTPVPSAEPEDSRPHEPHEALHPQEQTGKAAVPEKATQLFWDAFTRRDFATAYWLARELEAFGVPAPGVVPPWLCLSYLGCERNPEGIADAQKMLLSIYEAHPDPAADLTHWLPELSSLDQALLITLGSLRPLLFAPASGAQGWVQKAAELAKEEGLRRILEGAMQFAQTGMPFSPVLLKGPQSEGERREEFRRRCSDLAEWRDQARTSRTTYQLATRVLHHLATPNSIVGQAVEHASAGNHDSYDLVQSVIDEHLSDQAAIEALIQATARELHRGPRFRPLEAKALRQVVRHLIELGQLLRAWLRAAGALDQPAQYDWVTQQAQALWYALDESMPRLTSLLTEAAPAPATFIRRSAAQALAATRRLMVGEGAPEASTRDWQQDLMRPLLVLDNPPINESGLVHPEEELPAGESLWQALSDGRTLRIAFDSHLEAQRVDLAQLILAELEHDNEPSDLVSELAERIRDRRLEASTAVRRKLHSLRDSVERATLDHVLADDARAELDARLLQVEQALEKESTGNFPALHEVLNTIEMELKAAWDQRERSLRELVGELQVRAKSAADSIRADVEKYLQQATTHLDAQHLALADEFLTYAEDALRLGTQVVVEPERFESTGHVRGFVQFIEAVQQKESRARHQGPNWVIERLIDGKNVPPVIVADLSGSRRTEVQYGLAAFLRLKKQRGAHPSAFLSDLRNVLTYMGFHEPKLSVKDRHPNAVIVDAAMSAGHLSPLPQFGSQRGGRYHVVVVSQQPSADMIGQILHEAKLTHSCPIILFCSRLTPRQRQEWSAYCLERELTALLVDEYLLCFLAGQAQSRLPACISCGIAWGYANPYSPFGAGSVPPEVFKGRSRMVQQLVRTDGASSSILYGGRQFGKSAMLRKIEREHHDPASKSYVLYLDIKTLGDPASSHEPSEVWARLRSWFVQEGLLQPRISDRREKLEEALLALFDREKDLRILVLLDEADSFLAADARQNFTELQGLKRIMDATHRRFKVVLSGLHGVQRYASLPNHPFAHLGEPVVVGPLEPKAARELVEEPLSALGFEFADEAVVFRILCYTNYHPALIQHFCSQLIPLVRKRSRSGPPYTVTMEHVEQVYRSADVRRVMRERFEWTVALDARYEAIVYGMIFEQLDDADGYRKTFTVRDVRDLVMEGWPQGFASATFDDIKSLLEELIGLGILVKLENGHYRLRNGNVVRALGSPEEIVERLEEVWGRTPPPEDLSGSLRPQLDAGRCSPLTVQQLRQATGHGSGLVFVYGSRALGLDRVPSALTQMMASRGGEDASAASCASLPPECVSVRSIIAYLDELMGRYAWGRHLVVVPASQLSSTGEPLDEVLREVQARLTKRRSQNRTVRLVVLFEPGDFLQWFGMSGMQELEGIARAVIGLHRWDDVMIEQYLRWYGLFSPPKTVKQVAEATGRWPWLIECLYDRLSEQHDTLAHVDPSIEAARLREDLVANGTLAQKFLDSTGLNLFSHAPRLLHQLKALEPLAVSDLAAVLHDVVEELQIPADEVKHLLEVLRRLAVIEEDAGGLHVDPTILALLPEG